MQYLEFLKIAETPLAGAREKTLQLCHVIYEWISNNGYADTADSPDFIAHMNAFRECSASTLNTHLLRMAKAGLLKRKILRRKFSTAAKEELVPFPFFRAGIESLPTSFTRYHLPNQECSREFKSAMALHQKINADYEKILSRNNLGEFK